MKRTSLLLSAVIATLATAALVAGPAAGGGGEVQRLGLVRMAAEVPLLVAAMHLPGQRLARTACTTASGNASDSCPRRAPSRRSLNSASRGCRLVLSERLDDERAELRMHGGKFADGMR